MTATLGIDLASKPARTALALIDWTPARPQLKALCLGAGPDGTKLHDKFLSTAAQGLRFDLGGEKITKVGIDAPFGWPIPFVAALSDYTREFRWPVLLDDDHGALQRRTTDLLVDKRTTSRPLPVSVDKIGYCAMRCALLLADLAGRIDDAAVRRDGSGLVCEVYPDPALRGWAADYSPGLAPRASYKGKERIRERKALLLWIAATVGLDDPHGLIVGCADRKEDDFIDALLCALVARAVEVGQTLQPSPGEEQKAADAEGWIHLPTRPLAELSAATR